MPILIDGHNLIGRMPTLSLQDPNDEEDLVSLLISYRARTGKAITVVFDPGGSPGLLSKRRHGGVEVVFAPQRGGADDLIARRVIRSPDPSGYTVVTSDQELAARVVRRGGRVRSADDFAAELGPAGEAGDTWKDAPPTSEEVDGWLNVFGDSRE
jgi:predicted RNA-binding protein with PIN domain